MTTSLSLTFTCTSSQNFYLLGFVRSFSVADYHTHSLQKGCKTPRPQPVPPWETRLSARVSADLNEIWLVGDFWANTPRWAYATQKNVQKTLSQQEGNKKSSKNPKRVLFLHPNLLVGDLQFKISHQTLRPLLWPCTGRTGPGELKGVQTFLFSWGVLL